VKFSKSLTQEVCLRIITIEKFNCSYHKANFSFCQAIASVEMQLSLIKLTFSNEQQSAACRLLNEDSDAGRNCRSDPEGQVLFIYILKVSFPLPRNKALHFNLLLAVRREPILIRKDVKSGITTAIIRTEEGGGMNE
jgi:hypothetical protein